MNRASGGTLTTLERNAAGEEPDENNRALAGDQTCGARQGIVGADEVQHGGVRALEVIGVGGRVGTEFERTFPFPCRRGGTVDRCVGQQPQVLDRKLAQPTGTENECTRTWLECRTDVVERAVCPSTRRRPAAPLRQGRDRQSGAGTADPTPGRILRIHRPAIRQPSSGGNTAFPRWQGRRRTPHNPRGCRQGRCQRRQAPQ